MFDIFYIPAFQPTQQQTRYRKSPYAPANGEGILVTVDTKLNCTSFQICFFFLHKSCFKCCGREMMKLNILFWDNFVDGGSVSPEDAAASE